MKANVSIKRIDKKHVFYLRYDIYDIMTYSFFENIRVSTTGGVFLVGNTCSIQQASNFIKTKTLPKQFFPKILWFF